MPSPSHHTRHTTLERSCSRAGVYARWSLGGSEKSLWGSRPAVPLLHRWWLLPGASIPAPRASSVRLDQDLGGGLESCEWCECLITNFEQQQLGKANRRNTFPTSPRLVTGTVHSGVVQAGVCSRVANLERKAEELARHVPWDGFKYVIPITKTCGYRRRSLCRVSSRVLKYDS